MGLTLIFTFLVNLVLIQSRTEVAPGPVFKPDNHTHFDVYASALSRAHYNPWVCDYRSEPGYKCLSCSSALHCYPANFALLVQCAGIFPYCRNGYCSRFKTEGCTEEADPHIAVYSTLPPFVQMFIKGNKTTVAPDNSASHETSQTVINDTIPEESASNTVAAQVNDQSTNSAQTSDTSNKKPKESRSSQISEEINLLGSKVL